jgi:hypothetical protein
MPANLNEIYNNANVKIVGDCQLIFDANGTVTVKRAGVADVSYATLLLTIHVTGKVKTAGTVDGRVTVGATDDIEISGDLRHENRADDVLGMVSQNNIVLNVSSSSVADKTIDAALMSLNGSFYVQNYNSGVARGTLNIYGSIIQKNRGPVSTFSGNNISTGYAKNYIYDEKLINTPPPNFPTTGKIVSRSFVDNSAFSM